jgi:uncharacterized Zn finger protein
MSSSFIPPDPWPRAWDDALSDAALRYAAGDTVYERGHDYAAAGAVEVLTESPLPRPALGAKVFGSEPYATEVWIENCAVAGTCSCPHAADGSFCKHQVAVALVWRASRTGSGLPLPVDRPRSGEHDTALHAFLSRQPAAVLVAKLLELAASEPWVRRQLRRWRELEAASSDPKDIRRFIDTLLPKVEELDFEDEALSDEALEQLLHLLRQARARDPGGALALCTHALLRAWPLEACEQDETLSDLCDLLGEEWLACLQVAGPQPAGFEKDYLALRLADGANSVDPGEAEDAMGPAALQRFRQLLAQRWRQAKDAVRAARPWRGRRGGAPADLRRLQVAREQLPALEALHLEQLEIAGDLDAALAVLREDLSEPAAHSRAIEFLQRHGRHAEALAQAEQAHAAFPDDAALEMQLLNCCGHEGLTAQVLALRRRQFEQYPSVSGYRELLQAAQADGQDAAALREEMMAALEAWEVQAAGRRRSRSRSWEHVLSPAPAGQRDVTLRAAILADEGRWAEACRLVSSPAWCEAATLHHIALHLGDEQRHDAVQLLQRVLDDAMDRAASPYEPELGLVQDIAQRLEPAERTAWLAELRARYKPKRNFIKGLPAG